MEESSDESFTRFAWTDASSASEDSDETSVDKMTEKHTESESEKSYKRKLHKKLFNQEADVKYELLNGDSVKHEPDSDTAATPRKRKRKRERSTSAESTGYNYLEARVKQESHLDEKPKKKKKKHSENANGSQDISQISELDTTNHNVNEKKYLEARVKEESNSDEKPKKHKKKHSENANDRQNVSQNSELDFTDHNVNNKQYQVKAEHNSDEKPKKHKKRYNENANDSQDVSQSSELDTTDHNVKKKKSKRKKERPDKSNELINEDQFEGAHESNEMIIEDKFEAEETVVETRPRQSSINMNVDEDTGPRNEIVRKEKKKKKKRHVSEQEHHNDSSAQENTLDVRTSFMERDTNEDAAVENHNTDEQLHNSSKSKQPKQKATKISERLQFEDGDDVIAACNEATESFSNQSSKMKKFLRVNPHLHSIQCASSGDSIISKDDDVWLFNCPHEVDVSSLKDSDISLDNKCKIKIDSHTFIGHVENEKNRAAILTFEHNRPVIKSVELQGVVNFRKRIPKPHFREDNIIANNQTNFIPLPDTKCRHPLFGPDYKKAMKIPSAIKSRLQNSDTEHAVTPKEERKKKKKRKYDETDMGVDVPDGLVTDETAEEGTSRKRQHSELDTDQPAKKKKKIKQEKSGESWDSVKAIEENLFNF